MDTPICDFVTQYSAADPLRMHMPGHKGFPYLGSEHLDITEIQGADNLFDPQSIIRKSEENAGSLFGCHTLYSTEGSSLCIRAMLYLCMLYAKSKGCKPMVAAPRNVHSAFVSAAALLDFDIQWLYPEQADSYLSYTVTPRQLEHWLSSVPQLPVAVYLTTPDYLGVMSDIQQIAQVCHKFGVLLAVDNAHGAYLKFLPQSLHPIDLGADLCCDSAHKTLPVLTGGAYLHISRQAPKLLLAQGKQAMALFASTSPSYLILQSLDRMNRDLAEDYPLRLRRAADRLNGIKKELLAGGWKLVGDEPLKLTLDAAAWGRTGEELKEILRQSGVCCEFADRDFLVLMPSADTEEREWLRLEAALKNIHPAPPRKDRPPALPAPEKVCSIRRAMFSPRETLPAEKAVGRVLADAALSCPPAVPVVIAGERITEEAAACMAEA